MLLLAHMLLLLLRLRVLTGCHHLGHVLMVLFLRLRRLRWCIVLLHLGDIRRLRRLLVHLLLLCLLLWVLLP